MEKKTYCWKIKLHMKTMIFSGKFMFVYGKSSMIKDYGLLGRNPGLAGVEQGGADGPCWHRAGTC